MVGSEFGVGVEAELGGHGVGARRPVERPGKGDGDGDGEGDRRDGLDPTRDAAEAW